MINNVPIKLIIKKLEQKQLLKTFIELTFEIPINNKTIFHYKNNSFYFYNYPNIIIFKLTKEKLPKYKNKIIINNKITIYNISIPKCNSLNNNLSKFILSINNKNKKEVEQLLTSYLPSEIINYFH